MLAFCGSSSLFDMNQYVAHRCSVYIVATKYTARCCQTVVVICRYQYSTILMDGDITIYNCCCILVTQTTAINVVFNGSAGIEVYCSYQTVCFNDSTSFLVSGIGVCKCSTTIYIVIDKYSFRTIFGAISYVDCNRVCHISQTTTSIDVVTDYSVDNIDSGISISQGMIAAAKHVIQRIAGTLSVPIDIYDNITVNLISGVVSTV